MYHLTPDAHPEAELFIMLASLSQSLNKELGSAINIFPFIKEEIKWNILELTISVTNIYYKQMKTFKNASVL